MVRSHFRSVLLFLVMAALAGCGLIDSNIADFDLSLPEKRVTVDSADWMLADEANVPAVSCETMVGVCNAAVGQFCGNDQACFGSCDGSNCQAEVLVNLFQPFDLQEEKPELREIDGKPLVNITISRIGYVVEENTMTVPSTPIDVYIGPVDAVTSGHPQAERIGTIPVIDAGVTVEDGEVELTDDAEEIVGRFMRNYTTPFNIIVGSRVMLSAGDPIPQGRLVAIVQVEATAGF